MTPYQIYTLESVQYKTKNSNLKKELREKIEKLDKSLEDIEKALKVINDTVKNVLCPACGGTGTTRYADAAGAMDDKPCADCNGTGIKMTKEELT